VISGFGTQQLLDLESLRSPPMLYHFLVYVTDFVLKPQYNNEKIEPCWPDIIDWEWEDVVGLDTLNHSWRPCWPLVTTLVDVGGLPWQAIESAEALVFPLQAASSTILKCFNPSKWLSSLACRFFFWGHNWNKSPQNLQQTLYKNYFCCSASWSPTRTNNPPSAFTESFTVQSISNSSQTISL
jgi:hypothetical protein